MTLSKLTPTSQFDPQNLLKKYHLKSPNDFRNFFRPVTKTGLSWHCKAIGHRISHFIKHRQIISERRILKDFQTAYALHSHNELNRLSGLVGSKNMGAEKEQFSVLWKDLNKLLKIFQGTVLEKKISKSVNFTDWGPLSAAFNLPTAVKSVFLATTPIAPMLPIHPHRPKKAIRVKVIHSDSKSGRGSWMTLILNHPLTKKLQHNYNLYGNTKLGQEEIGEDPLNNRIIVNELTNVFCNNPQVSKMLRNVHENSEITTQNLENNNKTTKNLENESDSDEWDDTNYNFENEELANKSSKKEYDSEGYDPFGFDKNGYDKKGVNRYGYHREGYYVERKEAPKIEQQPDLEETTPQRSSLSKTAELIDLFGGGKSWPSPYNTPSNTPKSKQQSWN